MTDATQVPHNAGAAVMERLWAECGAADDAINAGYEALGVRAEDDSSNATTIRFTDVTLRDGQQQRTNEVTPEQRLEVFDQIVATGVDRIETGHLGNQEDREFAAALVGHIAQQEKADERYGRVKLQVLFGSQENLIQQGSDSLRQAFQRHYGDNWQEAMTDKVVVHVYDRIDPNLIGTANNIYTPEQSAARIHTAAQHATGRGFKHFSVSAEAATAVRPEDAVQFYRFLNQALLDSGAETVNDNLANTYGYAPHENWNAAVLTVFNQAVKHGFGGNVTTSIHAHNDTEAAADFAMAAAVGGFDRVESTHIGMGERSGNVASVTFMARILEQARHRVIAEERPGIQESRIAHMAGSVGLRHTVRVDGQIMDNLTNWYDAGERIAGIFGPDAAYRWRRTSLGSPYTHDNGSGPHDAALAAAASRPVECPPDRNYEWMLAITAAMGRPESEAIAVGDPAAIDQVTVGNHMGGGKTQAIKEGRLQRAAPERVEEARRNFRARVCAIGEVARRGVIIRAA